MYNQNKYILFIFIIFSTLSGLFGQTKVTIPASKDNTVYELFDQKEVPLSNGSGDYFFAGVNGPEGGSRIVRGLMQFDLQKYIPANAIILDVTLVLTMDQTNSKDQTVSIYPLLKDWGEGASDAPNGEGLGASAQQNDATWLHTFYDPSSPDDPNTLWTNKGGDFSQTASASTLVIAPDTYSWGSTESMINDVQSWLKDPKSNYGWIIRGDESGEFTAKRFVSKDNPEGGGPQLIVSYEIPNEPPVAVNDTSATKEETAVQISVLKNDYDSDGSLVPSSITIIDSTGNGTLAAGRTGIVTYTPDKDFFGNDAFSYTVQDNDGATSNTAKVIIYVNPINDPPVAYNDSGTTDEDQDVIIDILSNDEDDHGLDISSVNITDKPANGSITNIDEKTGAVIYSPDDNYYGEDTFSYTVRDDSGAVSNKATVTIKINSVNDNPVAENDSGAVNEDGSVAIDVLSNDTDIDGSIDFSSLQITESASHGTTTINTETGEITYQPDHNYFGSDGFSYMVDDNDGAASNTAVVSVIIHSVNDAPVANNDQVNTEEDTPVIISPVTNDSDIDGILVLASVTITNNPSNGNITNINSETGQVTYAPQSGFNGLDSFNYTIEDDSGAVSNAALVTISVGSVNDFPVTQADEAETDEDNSVVIDILNNDSDSDGQLIVSSIMITANPIHGNITNINATTGAVTYQPVSNYHGNDFFKYTVEDDSGAVSGETDVSIIIYSVNDPPEITGLPDAIEMDNSGVYQMELTAMDNDLPDDSLRWSFSKSNDSLNIDFNPDGNVLTLTTLPSFMGYVKLYVTVTDDSSASAMDSLMVQVTGTVLAIDNLKKDLPVIFGISQNYPNPFNPSTTINYQVPITARIKIAVFNLRGQMVKELVNSIKMAGRYIITFKAINLASGLYFYRMEAGHFITVKRMLLIK